MNRRAFLAAAGATAIAGCNDLLSRSSTERSTCEIDRSRERGTSDWPSFRGDVRNTGAAPSAALPSPPLTVEWTFPMPGFAGSLMPAVAGDDVFTTNYGDIAYGLDTEGTQRWQRTLPDVFGWSPTILDEWVLLLTDDGLQAHDRKTGTRVWTSPHPAAPATFEGAPVSDGEIICIGSELSIVGVDAATGEHRWEHRTGLETGLPPALVDGTVYAGSRDTYVYALDAETGATHWRYKTDGRIECAPAVVDETVYVGSDDGFVYSLDAASGALRWRRKVGHRVRSLAVTGGHVFAPAERESNEIALTAIRSDTGEQCWRTEEYAGSVPITAGVEYLYGPVHDEGGSSTIGALDPTTGEIVWRLRGFDGRLYNGPSVADNALYVGGVGAEGVVAAKLVEVE